jgi:hypothetical protein
MTDCVRLLWMPRLGKTTIVKEVKKSDGNLDDWLNVCQNLVQRLAL